MSKTDTITRRDKSETITAREFDRRFEAGEDITPFLDVAAARRPGRNG